MQTKNKSIDKEGVSPPLNNLTRKNEKVEMQTQNKSIRNKRASPHLNK